MTEIPTGYHAYDVRCWFYKNDSSVVRNTAGSADDGATWKSKKISCEQTHVSLVGEIISSINVIQLGAGTES